MIPVRNAVKATHWKSVPHPTQHNQLMMTPCNPSGKIRNKRKTIFSSHFQNEDTI
jgi:hypothetical protein